MVELDRVLDVAGEPIRPRQEFDRADQEWRDTLSCIEPVAGKVAIDIWPNAFCEPVEIARIVGSQGRKESLGRR
jgi:hypothetical protein